MLRPCAVFELLLSIWAFALQRKANKTSFKAVKILDQYLLKLYLKNYFFSLLVLTFLFLLIDVLTTLNRFQVSGSIYLGYYTYYLPWIISQMMPIAGVLATVFLFVSIQKNNELVIFHAMGNSIYRVLAPVILTILGLSAFGWFLSDQIVPMAMEQRNYYYYVEMKKRPASFNQLKKKNIWLRTPEAIVNFKQALSKSEISGVRVFFYDAKEWKPTRIIEAERATLSEDKWIYKKGMEVTYTEEGVVSKNFDEITTGPLEDLTEFKKRQSRVESMSLSELSFAIKKAKEASMASRQLETEYHGKLSSIFSALFLSLLALPFCLGNQRSTNVFVGLGITLALVVGYWVVYTTLLSMGRSGILPPIVSGWLAGALSVLIFLVVIRRKTA
jgi:lipopolysaccharide export system permease protein